jgi:hypothetical protein
MAAMGARFYDEGKGNLMIKATMYTAQNKLNVSYTQSLDTSSSNKFSDSAPTSQTILQQADAAGDGYSLLFSSNPPPLNSIQSYDTGVDWFDSKALTDALQRPFFYQDKQNTFFVESTMTEPAINDHASWAAGHPASNYYQSATPSWQNAEVQATASGAQNFVPQQGVDPAALYPFQPSKDWLASPSTVLLYGNNFVGANGGLTFATQSLQSLLSGKAQVRLQPVAPSSTTSGNGSSNGTDINLVDQSGLTSGGQINAQAEQLLESIRLASGNALP